MKYYVYILHNKIFDKFYITGNLSKRVSEHNEKTSGYTAKYKGKWKLVYKESFNDRKTAMRRGKFLKKQKNKDFCRKLFS
jgi:predicted GIY-YIG superfamily endonuclease